ncbi:unnamed protein product [Heterobilharzia americana]|nr:unnamed protein product [Heterobilharzia americana]
MSCMPLSTMGEEYEHKYYWTVRNVIFEKQKRSDDDEIFRKVENILDCFLPARFFFQPEMRKQVM